LLKGASSNLTFFRKTESFSPKAECENKGAVTFVKKLVLHEDMVKNKINIVTEFPLTESV
jgi:hypothetical protein